MNVLILFNDPYPIGQAPTNRIHSLAKGLLETGIDIKLYILRATEDPSHINNPNVKGSFEGVEYEYITNTTIKETKYIKKIIIHLITQIKLIFLLLKSRSKINFIIYPLDSLTLLFIVWIATRFTKIKIIRHVDEYPPFVLNPAGYSAVAVYLYKNFFYKLVDAVIPMTKKLEEYYKTLSPRNVSFLHLPMTVDTDRFQITRDNELKEEFITYCGNLGHNNKDGLPDLIKAYNIVQKKYPTIKLKIIGSSRNENDIILLKKLVKSLDLEEKVIFTGNVYRDEIPIHLCKSKVLALSRPNNKQAEGGFPTKLGEYLATGKPVVVTDVGEITNYLEDGVSAFIARPDDYVHFSDKLIEVLDNYEKALKVGEAGRLVAFNIFYYKKQGLLLRDFIRKLL
jgi:glycosyltransferase involved in cell wall biosynthesis